MSSCDAGQLLERNDLDGDQFFLVVKKRDKLVGRRLVFGVEDQGGALQTAPILVKTPGLNNRGTGLPVASSFWASSWLNLALSALEVGR